MASQRYMFEINSEFKILNLENEIKKQKLENKQLEDERDAW